MPSEYLDKGGLARYDTKIKGYIANAVAGSAGGGLYRHDVKLAFGSSTSYAHIYFSVYTKSATPFSSFGDVLQALIGASSTTSPQMCNVPLTIVERSGSSYSTYFCIRSRISFDNTYYFYIYYDTDANASGAIYATSSSAYVSSGYWETFIPNDSGDVTDLVREM